jgi:ABC-type sugar transport system ATPase subunit
VAEVRLDAVTKRFDAVAAVDEVAIDIADGEFLALLGPSGCGKTTTLRMVASLERPTTGRIWIGGRDVTDLGPRERDVAMVFQDYALYPHMTVEENIDYPLRVRRRPRQDTRMRVREVADMLGLGGLLTRRPGQLSGGQQQRVALARALVYQPKALLLDEPLSNLDAKLRLEARAFLGHFQKSLGITTIYVTHDQSEAMALADRVAVMNNGKLLQVGRPLDVYRYPATMFVAGFIGSPPMNLLQAEAVGGEGGGTLGIRPEHLRMTAPGEDGALPVTVYAVEPLGFETLVRVKLGDHELVVRCFDEEAAELPVGTRAGLALDRSYALTYDGDGRLRRG